MGTAPDFRFTVVGAGAIGSVLAGFIARTGYGTTLVGREDHVAAINRSGLAIQTYYGPQRIELNATTVCPPLSGPDDIVLLTTKSGDTDVVAQDLAKRVKPSVPIICCQNGVQNERRVSQFFENVYGAVISWGAIYLREPGQVTYTSGNTMTLGRYPAGIDDVVTGVTGVLVRAGFNAAAEQDIMRFRYAKLLMNLKGAVYALTGMSQQDALADPTAAGIIADATEEGARVLAAAGIEFDEPPGFGSWDEYLGGLRNPASVQAGASKEIPSRNSDWQDAYLKRQPEADFINGEIVRLGEQSATPTPVNEALLEMTNSVAEQQLGVGSMSAADVRSALGAPGSLAAPGSSGAPGPSAPSRYEHDVRSHG